MFFSLHFEMRGPDIPCAGFFCRISPRNAGPRFSGRGPLIVPAALTGRVSRCRRESRAVRVVFGLWHTASYESSRKEFFRNVYKIAAMLGTLGDKCQGSEWSLSNSILSRIFGESFSIRSQIGSSSTKRSKGCGEILTSSFR